MLGSKNLHFEQTSLVILEQILRNTVLDHFKPSTAFSSTPIRAGPHSRHISLYKARQIYHTALLHCFSISMPIATFLVDFHRVLRPQLFCWTPEFYVILCPPSTHTHFDFYFPSFMVSSPNSKSAIQDSRLYPYPHNFPLWNHWTSWALKATLCPGLPKAST